jgi:hypothetical protein
MAVKPSQDKAGTPRNKSIGPLFDIVATNDPEGLRRYPIHVLGLRMEATGWQITGWDRRQRCEVTRDVADIANELVVKFNETYGLQHHWEKHRRVVASDDGLKGTPARQEAIRRILEGSDGPGKRFLQGLKEGQGLTAAIAEKKAMPDLAKGKTAQREDLEALRL